MGEQLGVVLDSSSCSLPAQAWKRMIQGLKAGGCPEERKGLSAGWQREQGGECYHCGLHLLLNDAGWEDKEGKGTRRKRPEGKGGIQKLSRWLVILLDISCKLLLQLRLLQYSPNWHHAPCLLALHWNQTEHGKRAGFTPWHSCHVFLPLNLGKILDPTTGFISSAGHSFLESD